MNKGEHLTTATIAARIAQRPLQQLHDYYYLQR